MFLKASHIDSVDFEAVTTYLRIKFEKELYQCVRTNIALRWIQKFCDSEDLAVEVMKILLLMEVLKSRSIYIQLRSRKQ